MAKWDYLIESDERFRRAVRRAAETKDSRAYHKALARMRGVPSSETVERWGELEVLNARAKRGLSRHSAQQWVKDALNQGFAVIMRSLDHRSDATTDISIFTGMRDVWYYISSSGWPVSGWRVARLRHHDVLASVREAYSFLDDLVDTGIPTVDDEGRPMRFLRPTMQQLRMSVPQFAAIPFSALPVEIQRNIAMP